MLQQDWLIGMSPAAEVQHHSFMGVWPWLTAAQQHNIPLKHMQQHHQALDHCKCTLQGTHSCTTESKAQTSDDGCAFLAACQSMNQGAEMMHQYNLGVCYALSTSYAALQQSSCCKL
jgi:hypothetical protein